jgi:putative flippase GtrA
VSLPEAAPSAGLVQRLLQRRGVRQFVKFGIVGASGLLVNLAIFTLLRNGLSDDDKRRLYNVTYSIAFLSGGVSNYFLNRIWTFRATGPAVLQGIAFLTVSAIALTVGLLVSALAKPYLGSGHRTWLVATLAGIVVNFFVNKYWTFRPAAK